MALNKKEEEILKQIELELSKEDPDLAKTVETSTLSSFSRTRSVISFGTFVLGSTYNARKLHRTTDYCYGWLCIDGSIWICLR